MRAKLILLFAFIFLSCNTKKASDSRDTVYICTGGSSERFHSDKNCKGLRRCSGNVIEVTSGEAIGMGRTPCKICY